MSKRKIPKIFSSSEKIMRLRQMDEGKRLIFSENDSEDGVR